MGLRNLSFPTLEVETSGGTFAVRGLSLDHILTLFHRHRGEMSGLFDRFTGNGPRAVSLDDMTSIGMALLDGTPDIVAEIIAIAAGGNPKDMDSWLAETAIARKLSVAEQASALDKILGATFTSEMPPRKLVAVVLKAMQGTTAMISAPAV